MIPREGPFSYRCRGCIVDGAMVPQRHMSHNVIRVLEHIPKCCLSDYSHNSRVLCSCGEEFRVSDQFIDWLSNPVDWKADGI